MADVFTGGTASADKTVEAPASNAFDDNTATYSYQSGGFPYIIKYDLGAGNSKTVIRYREYLATGQGGNPKDWYFEGSTDDTNWTTLDTVAGNPNSNGVWDSWHSFTNATAYRYYRWRVTAGYGTIVSHYELEGEEGTLTQKTLSVVEVSIPTITSLFTWAKAMSATLISIATISPIKLFIQVMSAVAVSIASISRAFVWSKVLSATMVGVASISRLLTLSKVLSAVVASVPSLSTMTSRFRTLSATVVSSLPAIRTVLKIHSKTIVKVTIVITILWYLINVVRTWHFGI